MTISLRKLVRIFSIVAIRGDYLKYIDEQQPETPAIDTLSIRLANAVSD
jgi:hypothetical protein